jgi:hypothetical protein
VIVAVDVMDFGGSLCFLIYVFILDELDRCGGFWVNLIKEVVVWMNLIDLVAYE